MNVPKPPPSFVLGSAMVGFKDVLQQTPFMVTVEPPSAVTLPPDIAVVVVTPVTLSVVTVANTGFV